jgi:diacylglycerol kinase
MAVLFLTVLLLIVTEFTNTAVEAAVNVATTEIHPMAKVAKDVAAAAVMVMSTGTMLMGLIILGVPFIDKLGL